MAIDVSKDLEERFLAKLKGGRCGRYGSPDELLERALSTLDLDERFRGAVAEGAAEADRGELIAGDDALAEIDGLIAEVDKGLEA